MGLAIVKEIADRHGAGTGDGRDARALRVQAVGELGVQPDHRVDAIIGAREVEAATAGRGVHAHLGDADEARAAVFERPGHGAIAAPSRRP